MAFEDPITLEIPAERKIIRINGADTEVWEFKDFWRAVYADGNVAVFSNPLQDFDLRGAQGDPAPPKYYFRVVAAGPGSNPGDNDSGPSLTTDPYII